MLCIVIPASRHRGISAFLRKRVAVGETIVVYPTISLICPPHPFQTTVPPSNPRKRLAIEEHKGVGYSFAGSPGRSFSLVRRPTCSDLVGTCHSAIERYFSSTLSVLDIRALTSKWVVKKTLETISHFVDLMLTCNTEENKNRGGLKVVGAITGNWQLATLTRDVGTIRFVCGFC